jgi:hypothetical protein
MAIVHQRNEPKLATAHIVKNENPKSNKRSMAETIIGETRREGQRKAKRQTTCMTQNRGRKLVPLMIGSYFIHGPSIVLLVCKL